MAKTVLLGVTGSIAAYKACLLVREFAKAGLDVRVAMTAHAAEFVTPLTFRTLSRNPVECDMFADQRDWRPGHVSLAELADIAVVAPATANIIAKAAHGIADDFLSSLLLATRAPVLFAPAMNEGMWLNPATRENVETLSKRGARFVSPEEGELACGSSGPGRMANPARVFAAAMDILNGKENAK